MSEKLCHSEPKCFICEQLGMVSKRQLLFNIIKVLFCHVVNKDRKVMGFSSVNGPDD